jgi:hypothetical protein
MYAYIIYYFYVGFTVGLQIKNGINTETVDIIWRQWCNKSISFNFKPKMLQSSLCYSYVK